MAKVTILTGLILVVMGLGGYFGSGGASVTALIPAFFGLPILAAGFIALNETRRKHAIHSAVALALIGFLGSVPGLLKLGSLLSGTAERPMAVAMQGAMALLLAVYIVLCVQSFIAARKARQRS